MILIAGQVRIDPAQRDAAVAAARGMMQATREEPGCISYTFSADLDEPGLFHLFEEWESQPALDAHFGTPHMAEFQKAIGALDVRESRIQRYEVSSVAPLGG